MGRKSKKHRRDEGAHECSECGKSFKTDRKLERHMLKAHGKTPTNPMVKYGAVAAVLILIVAVGIVLAGGAGDGEAAVTRAQNMERFELADDPHLGNASAPVVVVEYATPRCPSCKAVHDRLLPDFRDRWIDPGDVVWYYLQFNIGYPYDEPGGVAQECVLAHGGNDAFWGFTDFLYGNQGRVSESNTPDAIQQWADANGHDGAPMVDCYDRRAGFDAYDQDLRNGRSNGVSGTPTFFVFGPTGEAVRTNAGDLDQTVSRLVADAEQGA